MKNSISYHRSKGFTMMEVLMIVGIIGLLTVALFYSFRTQKLKADDARMKDDLNKLKIAIEEFYNDNNCYPPAEWFSNASYCGSNYLQPYLQSIPCQDPSTPYHLELDDTGCGWFKLYTNLNWTSDPIIQEFLVTDGSGISGYNYGVSSSNTVIKINSPAALTYCETVRTGGPGNCNAITEGQICSPSYDDANCGGTQCDTNLGGQLGICN